MKPESILIAALTCAFLAGAVEVEPVDHSPCAYRVQTTVQLAEKLDVAVDGKDDEPFWRDASRITRLVTSGLYSPEGADTQVRFAADAEALYLFADLARQKDSSRPDANYERDMAKPFDSLEFFIKPTDENRQFQFMVDSRGNLTDIFYTWRMTDTKQGEGTWNRATRDFAWNAESLRLKTVDLDAVGWKLEMKIPWKDLGVAAPKEGDVMRMDVGRGDYNGGVTTIQSSQWALQKAGYFAMWPDWGRVVFSSSAPRVTGAEILPGAEKVSVDLVGGTKDVAAKVVVEEMNDVGELKPIGETSLTLAAGTKQVAEVALDEQTMLSWISVFADGKLLYRRGGRPAGKLLMVGLDDPSDVRKGRIFIPNDANWYTPFKIRHTLLGGGGNHLLGEPKDLNAKLVAEVPEGVTVTKIKYSDWGWDLPIRTAESEETFVRDGRTWRRYVLPAYISGVNLPLVFFRSTLPAGTKGTYRLYMTWNGGRQKPVDRPFEVVSYGRVKPFARMQLRMCDLTFNWAEAICGGEPVEKELPRLGVNVWKVPVFPSRLTSPSYGKESFKQRLDRFIAGTKTCGATWYLSIQNDLNGLMCWTTEKAHSNLFDLQADESARLVDFRGKLVRNQFQWWTICPNYRGRNFKDYANGVLSTEAVRDYGVTWIVCDWEFWDGTPCCCDRCRALWKEWCADRGLPDYGDPRVFLKDEAANAVAAEQYRAFFGWSRGKLFADLKRELNQGIDLGRASWSAPKSGTFVFSEWIRPRPGTMSSIDYHEWPWAFQAPDSESGAKEIGSILAKVTRGRTDQCVASVCPAQGCEVCRTCHPIMTFYNVLESAAACMAGFEWYYVPICDAETWKGVMDGLRIIRPYEDIVMDGVTTLDCAGENCTFRRGALLDEAIYLVRNYAVTRPTQVSFDVDAFFAGEVFDAETGEKLAAAGTGARRVTVTLTPERKAKLLYAGNRFAERREKSRE